MPVELPKISATQLIAPTSIAAVQVATGPDPLARVQEQNAKNVSSRIDQLSSFAFKKAVDQAKSAGAAYGARQAPTAEQIELAAKNGQPITLADLPGDPSSFNIAEQAAYAGALAVVENRLEMAGRKALTQLTLAAAADPELSPTEFGNRLDDVVQSYSNAMTTISPTSASKISAGLAMVANGQAVTFARNYATSERKRIKSAALADVNQMIEDYKVIISGHDPEAGELLDKKLSLNTLRSTLENAGHNETLIKTTLLRATKEISASKIAVITEWANKEFINDPTGPVRKLQAKKLPPHIRAIWTSMGNEDKSKARKELLDVGRQINETARIEQQRTELENKDIEKTAIRNFNASLMIGDEDAALKAINLMDSVKPDDAQKMRKLFAARAGALEDNQEDIRKLSVLRAHRLLDLPSIHTSELTAETKAHWVSQLLEQKDTLMRSAEDIAKGHFQVDLSKTRKQLSEGGVVNLNKYYRFVTELSRARRASEKSGLPFDPIEATEGILLKVEEAENKRDIKKLTSKYMEGLGFLPADQQSIQGLRAAITNKIYNENTRYSMELSVKAHTKLGTDYGVTIP